MKHKITEKYIISKNKDIYLLTKTGDNMFKLVLLCDHNEYKTYITPSIIINIPKKHFLN